MLTWIKVCCDYNVVVIMDEADSVPTVDMSDSEEYDLDDYPAIRDPDSEDEESGSSGNEGVLNSSNKDHLANDHGNDEESDSSELHEGVEESDSSEDEIKKKEKEDKLQSFLASADHSENWYAFISNMLIAINYRMVIHWRIDKQPGLPSPLNQITSIKLTKEDIKSISRLLKGKAPHGDFDPYAPYVDWFKWDGSKHPLSNAPDPKRRLIPTKSESKLFYFLFNAASELNKCTRVNKIKLAIRKGLIKPKKSKEVEEEEESVYPLWGDDSNSTEKNDHLSYIPAPKPKLPGNDFHPYSEDCEKSDVVQFLYLARKYIPTQEEINSYQLTYEEDRPKFIPKSHMRTRIKLFKLNIDPESLKPKLPNRNDLKPYPVSCYLEYRGHEDAVTSVSVEASGQWIASGLLDGTVRIWEVETGRCLKHYKIGEAIKYVAWNPNPEHSILAVSVGQDVLLLNTGCGNEEVQKRTKELLSVEMPVMTLFTQTLSFKLRGIAVTSVFHPALSFFFISTKKIIRVYDLVKEGKLVRKLEIRLREVSFIAVHPSDLNKNPLIVPLEILRGHSSTNERGVMDCKFHPRQPWLFTAGAGWLDVIAIERKRKETACTGSYCKLWISLVGSEFSVL
ncbi:Transducin/WD40 repeat-like superfamily protein [Prunus dulcis]|uniref:Transducin/WD40 repeat-like superfamily protein n=1 Tax=Prunus dulcis TaxID=3755 RepID=A0A4Y1RMA2_PRUDU|nr:Transducin/WD40 repeat-like superfamily protein [Prunus dulcis]